MNFILGMQINKIQFNINNNFSFKSTARHYQNNLGDEFGCNSWMFRNDVDWKNLTKIEEENFKNKNKVNIVMFASSDGSEAYSKIISLYEHFGIENPEEAEKFFPIQAYDVDKEILDSAKSGFIKTSMMDRMELQMHSENYEDYFEKTKEELKLNNDIPLQREKTLKAKNKLTKNVNFEYGDMFQKVTEIKDNSDTILMCRNILGYFVSDKIEKFIQKASMALKKDSLFIVGDHDSRLFDIHSCMRKYGFRELIHNVYKKI